MSAENDRKPSAAPTEENSTKYLAPTAEGQREKFTLADDLMVFGAAQGTTIPSALEWSRRFAIHRDASEVIPSIDYIAMANGVRGVEIATSDMPYLQGPPTASPKPTEEEVHLYGDRQARALGVHYDRAVTNLAIESAAVILGTRDPLRTVAEFNGRVTALLLNAIKRYEDSTMVWSDFTDFHKQMEKENKIMMIELAKARNQTNVLEVREVVKGRMAEELFATAEEEENFQRTGDFVNRDLKPLGDQM